MKEYIERDAAIKEIYSEIERTDPMQATEVLMGYDKGLRVAAALVINTPTADVVERVRGEWEYYWEGKELMCSVCKTTFWDENGKGGTNFCPNCGCQMVDKVRK